MFSKLAFKNARKSFKEYSIYFLTLTFGVCIFYTFNSLDSQQVMFDLNESRSSMLESISTVMGYLSVFVSIVLALLILYATSYLIRRRKQEFGVYMTLGMPKGKMSTIILTETFLIGIFALVSGLILGIFAAQGASIFTAKIFEINMKRFIFTVSKASILKTLLYFGIIFLVSMAMQVFIVSRSKLINLIKANKMNQSMKIKNLWVSVIIFIVSIVTLSIAYNMFHKMGLKMIGSNFLVMLILGALGTFLFFFSLAGFLLKLVQMRKSFYYKNLNMFVLRQINAKVNTNFFSMGLICLMLLLAIGVSATSFGLSTSMTEYMNTVAPYDATAMAMPKNTYPANKNFSTNFEKEFANHGYSTQEHLKNTYTFTEYQTTKVNFGTFKQYGMDLPLEADSDYQVAIVKQSDYNNLMKQNGKKEMPFKENEIGFIYNMDQIKTVVENFIEKNSSITLAQKQYSLNKNFITSNRMSNMTDEAFVLIVPDNFIEENLQIFSIKAHYYNGSFKDTDQEKASQKFNSLFSDSGKYDSVKTKYFGIAGMTSYEMKIMILGTKALFIFIGVYLSVIFLLVSAAVLALQQLSEANDSVHRYTLLKKLGVESKMINRSILTQIGIYFFIPLSLALVHTWYGLSVVQREMQVLANLNLTSSLLYSVGLFIIIFGGYYLATYFGYKRIVSDNK